MPKISVIIPIYKSEKYLSTCLDSILCQTFSDFEIICVNDGSPDNCLSILEQYQKNDQRIVIVNQENKAQAEARNIGIQKSTGGYLFFVDSDDKLHPQALQILYTIAEKTNAPITVSNFFIKSSKNQWFKNILDDASIDYIVHENPLKDMFNQRYLSSVVWNKLFKRETFEGHRFISGIIFEDWPLITCIFSEIPFYVSVDIPLYFYNDSDESTVRSAFTVKKLEDYITGINFVYNYYQQPKKQKYWRLVQKNRIKKSLKIVLSKVVHSKENKVELGQVFFEELEKLRKNKIFLIGDFSIKSKWRLLKLYVFLILKKRKI